MGLINNIKKFVEDKKEAPFVAALAAGLYPLFHYYSNNFTLINSWQQFVFNISYKSFNVIIA